MADLLERRVRENNLRERLGVPLGSRERLMRGVSQMGGVPRPVRPGEAPTPAVARPSIQQPAPGVVREPNGPVEKPQDDRGGFLKRIAALRLDPKRENVAGETLRLGILQAVAQNAPEGSPIRLVAQIMQAGILGQQEGRAAAERAARQQVRADALETGEFRAGAAALLELGDEEGAGLLLDRYDQAQKQRIEDARLGFEGRRVEIAERVDLRDEDKQAFDQEIKTRETALAEAKAVHGMQMDEARHALNVTKSRQPKVQIVDGRPIAFDPISGQGRVVDVPGVTFGDGDPKKPVKLTEQQGKSLVNAGRMSRAAAILETNGAHLISGIGGQHAAGLQGLSEGLGSIPVVGGILGGMAGQAAHEARDPRGRAAFQAGAEFLDAVIRQTSGANAPESEIQRARETYLPQVGDKPEDLERKARSRRAFIQDVISTLPAAAQARFAPQQ